MLHWHQPEGWSISLPSLAAERVTQNVMVSKWEALIAQEAVGAVLTMRMLCFLRRCFVSRRKRLLTSLSGTLLYSGTSPLQTHTKLQVQIAD